MCLLGRLLYFHRERELLSDGLYSTEVEEPTFECPSEELLVVLVFPING